MPSRPASKKSKVSRPLPASKQMTKYLSGTLQTFNASPIRTLPTKLLTFNASLLSPTKKRYSRAAKKMQALFRGHMARKMTKKINNAAKKVQSFFRGRSARNRTSRMRTAKRENKKEGIISRMMKKLDLKSLPDVSAPRTLRPMRQPSYRKNYKE